MMQLKWTQCGPNRWLYHAAPLIDFFVEYGRLYIHDNLHRDYGSAEFAKIAAEEMLNDLVYDHMEQVE